VNARRQGVFLALVLLPSVAAGLRTSSITDIRESRADSVVTLAYDVAGLRIIQRQTPASDVVAVRLYLLGGSRQNSAATAGIEALLLRTLELDRQRDVARLGGQPIREIGYDWSVIGFLSLKQDFDSVWAVFADQLLRPQPSYEGMTQAKAEMLGAAARRATQPDLRIATIAQIAAFPDHPYGIDVRGTERTLKRFTRPNLERYAAEQFVTSRMLLVVVGDVPRAGVESAVQTTLARLPAGNYQWTLPPEVEHRPRAWLTEHRVLPTNYILGYFAGPPPTHDDYFGFLIATQLLSSGIAQAVRDQHSLSYAAYAPFLDRAIPIGGVYASTQSPAVVYRIMKKEIGDLQADEVHPLALRRFVSQFRLDELGRQMTNDGQADALARAELYFGDWQVADDYFERLARVRPSDVRRAAIKYMPNIELAYLGDTTKMEGSW